MQHPTTRLPVLAVAVLTALGGRVAPALACAVCYGDPDSTLTQGAASGVLVLAGIIYTVLLAFVGVALFWTVRARRLRLAEPPSSLPEELDRFD